MSIIRTVFMGTPEIARHCLEAMYNDEHFEIVGVVSQPDRPAGRKMKMTPSAVKAWALEKGLKVLTPNKMSDEGIMEEIQSWRAEACVVVAFGQILKQEFLNLYPQKVVNVHASLLPKWRGAAPIQRAIEAGDELTGVSLQVMKLALDTGDVIGVRRVPITETMDSLELHDIMKGLAADILKVDFMDYLRGHLSAIAQDESQATYANKLLKSEAQLDWTLPAQTLFNKIKGFKMGPGSFTTFKGKKIKIHTVLLEEGGVGEPGVVVELCKESFKIQCGVGILKVFEVQPESKSKMSAQSFLQGHNLKAGERFGE